MSLDNFYKLRNDFLIVGLTEEWVVVERSRNHRDENKNVPSTGSGTESSSKYNTVIERSRNHREYE